MKRYFEIPTVGRAWLVLLGTVEAWFCRGATGFLLGPFETPAGAAEALLEDLNLALRLSNGERVSLPQADGFEGCNDGSFYADGVMLAAAGNLVGWSVPLRNGPSQAMVLLTDDRGLVPELRVASWDEALLGFPQLQAP